MVGEWVGGMGGWVVSTEPLHPRTSSRSFASTLRCSSVSVIAALKSASRRFRSITICVSPCGGWRVHGSWVMSRGLWVVGWWLWVGGLGWWFRWPLCAAGISPPGCAGLPTRVGRRRICDMSANSARITFSEMCSLM